MTPENRRKAYGSPDILPEQLKLKAGQLDVVYENGSLRLIKLRNIEILRMIYSAVRDKNWGTIEPRIESETIKIEESSFEIRLRVLYISGSIEFSADYLISGANNKICFKMFGEAQSAFWKNRIGFCILNPIHECAGKTAQVTHTDGSASEFIFPVNISPFQPVRNVQGINWEPAAGLKALLSLSGDIFEMEDQRNWSDASYKTYCTPLELPFPAKIKKGETVSQKVELFVENETVQFTQHNEFVLSIFRDQLFSLPELGTAMCSRKELLTQHELDLLKSLPFKHLRIEVNLIQPGIRNYLERATRESDLLGWPLFVVLYLSDDFQNEYRQFVELCNEFHTNVAYLLPVGQDHLAFNAFDEIEYQIRNDFPDVKLGTGVNAYFAELNRNRPVVEKADFVNFTICPQVHAFDILSMVENLEAQQEVIQSATVIFPGKPVFVSPVTLKQRFNVVATSADTEPEVGMLPSNVDPRQMSVFAATWTLGSLKFLTQAGADLISYYETVGLKGFIPGEYIPEGYMKTGTKVKDTFPVYDALTGISGFSEVVSCQSSHPLLFNGLLLKSKQETKLFLFSFSYETLEIRIEPRLDIKNIRSAHYRTKPAFSAMKIELRAWDIVVISA